MTKKFGIVGDPIKHSLSPLLHNYCILLIRNGIIVKGDIIVCLDMHRRASVYTRSAIKRISMKRKEVLQAKEQEKTFAHECT